jgi:hypothetical protein
MFLVQVFGPVFRRFVTHLLAALEMVKFHVLHVVAPLEHYNHCDIYFCASFSETNRRYSR